MVFQVSPSVSVTETDLTNIIPNVSTSTAATVGQFTWGPVEEITIVDNEEQLANIFGKPNDTNYEDFLSAASFLAYATGLKAIRVVDETGDSNTNPAANASATDTASGTGILVKNREHYDSQTFSTNLWIARYPGALGNSLGVAWADTAAFDDTDSQGDPTWPWHDLFNDSPGSNEFHIVVYDFDGGITGTTGTALERFAFVSTDTSAKEFDGTSAYFKRKINNGSAWIWIGDASLLSSGNSGLQLAGGENGLAVGDDERQTGFAMFKDDEEVDISIVFASGASSTTSKYIIDNVAEVRKDCVAIVGPQSSDVVGISSDTTKLSNILTTRNTYGSSSYAIMDSQYKYMYDRYNDAYRWISQTGDIAGLLARTDNEYDPWISPAGYSKGRIKNALKLSFKQSKTIRDELYKKGINPVTNFPAEGPVLAGDKTLQTKPSAFDRINVRRLFIVLEKAISTASRYMLFEQNDEFTRTRFVNMVEPFLREVKGRRGIEDFRVICDETNNPPQVRQNHEFVGDIYIKPVYSINYIKLNFVAVESGVSFDEIVLGTSPDEGTSDISV